MKKKSHLLTVGYICHELLRKLYAVILAYIFEVKLQIATISSFASTCTALAVELLLFLFFDVTDIIEKMTAYVRVFEMLIMQTIIFPAVQSSDCIYDIEIMWLHLRYHRVSNIVDYYIASVNILPNQCTIPIIL